MSSDDASTIENIRLLSISESRSESSTPVTTNICSVFQFRLVKVRVVNEILTSVASTTAIEIMTLEVGARSNLTEILFVTVPDSLTITEVGLTV